MARELRTWLFRWDTRIFLVICLSSLASFAAINITRNTQDEIFPLLSKPVQQDTNIVEKEEVENFSMNESVLVVMWDGGNPFGWAQGNVIKEPNYGGFTIVKETCPLRCEFTTDRSLMPVADAILFDPCLTGPDGFRDIPVYLPDKFPGQKWGWFTYEQLHYFPMMQEKEEYMNRFDYKMTYHHDALVQITFACPWGGRDDLLKPAPVKSSGKLVAFFASNCNTGGADRRTKYVEELMQYIPVHSYGACLHNTDMPWRSGNYHDSRMKEKIDVIGEYKFLLAFENNDEVDDYVTEKLINAFQAGTVPVYWGAPNVDMWAIGPHSMIKTTDFPSPKELAKYLKYLDEHDDEYFKYFEWKKNGISPSFQRLWDHCLFFAECNLCKALAKQKRIDGGYQRPYYASERGVVGYALQLNGLDADLYGDDDYVEVGAGHQLLDLETHYTLMAWIKLGFILDGRIIDKNQAGSIEGYELDVIESTSSPGRGHLRLCAGGGCFYSMRTLSVGLWYHVAATFSFESSNRKIELFINGKSDSVHTPSERTHKNKWPLRFGRAASGGSSWRPHHAGSVFDGTMDDISIWTRVLEKKEIYDYMFAKPKDNEVGLAGWWAFNEGEGNVVHDIGQHHFHGSIRGHPTWVVSVSKPILDSSNAEGRHPKKTT